MGDIDNLYKNLDHISKGYLTTESIILAWEAIFAIVICQLFIAYIGLCDAQKSGLFGSLIVLIGFILSICWFALFVISRHYQTDRVIKMNKLENLIKAIDSAFLGYGKPDKVIGKIHAWHVTQILPITFAGVWLVLWASYPNTQRSLFILESIILIIFAIWGALLFISLYRNKPSENC
jgi:hypothetical protein